MDEKKLKNILEAGLLVAGRTMSIAQLEALFQHDNDAEKPDRKQIREALDSLKQEYEGRGIELVEVASGFRLQSHESVSDWVANLFQEKTPRYSRALLETLVLIAYRQPITRAEIEDVRGVAVSSNIIKTLQERQWVKVLGHKEVPGRPALLGTSKEFLDYFNLKKLDDLPELADIKDLDQFDEMLAEDAGEVGEVGEQGDAANDDGGTSGDDSGPDDSTSGDSHQANSQGKDVDDNDDGDVGDANNKGAGEDTLEGRAEFSEQKPSEGQADSDEQVDSMLDLGAADAETVQQDVEQSDDDAKDAEHTEDTATGDELVAADEAIDHNETLTGPELDLLRVISDFSEEHQQEVDARDEMEARIFSNNDDEIDEADLSDLSQRVGDDSSSGDMPEPGDTLH